MYTQVKLPPLIPPMLWGETEKSSPLPLERGGLGWGNLRNNGDSITCVYTVAL